MERDITKNNDVNKSLIIIIIITISISKAQNLVWRDHSFKRKCTRNYNRYFFYNNI